MSPPSLRTLLRACLRAAARLAASAVVLAAALFLYARAYSVFRAYGFEVEIASPRGGIPLRGSTRATRVTPIAFFSMTPSHSAK